MTKYASVELTAVQRNLPTKMKNPKLATVDIDLVMDRGEAELIHLCLNRPQSIGFFSVASRFV